MLSAGQKIEKNNDGKPESVSVVNLLVTPEQAETLSLASNETRIQLDLRNPLDTKETKTAGTATANLFSGVVYSGPAAMIRPRSIAPLQARVSSTPLIRPAEPHRLSTTVEMIHGTKKTEEKFPEAPEIR